MFWIFPTIIALLIILSVFCVLVWQKIAKRRHIYTIVGVVKIGHGLGKQIGAQTSNLDVELAKDLPKGLYGCVVYVEGKKYDGVLYYGRNSLTAEDCLETHLFDFVGDIYGKSISIKTTHYIRPPKFFDSVQQLNLQVQKDLAGEQKRI